MAGVFFTLTTGELSLTAATAKTCLQLIAPTNQRIHIHELHVSFKGTSVTETPVDVQLKRQVNAPTASSLTLGKENSSDDEAIQSTATYNSTVEPTADGNDSVVSQVKVHPQDRYDWMWPPGKPLPVKGGSRLGVLINSPQSATVVVSARCEE